jgi:hypothetical protein
MEGHKERTEKAYREQFLRTNRELRSARKFNRVME